MFSLFISIILLTRSMLLVSLLFALLQLSSVDELTNTLSTKDVLVLVTMKNCKFCDIIKPIYTQVTDQLEGQADHMVYTSIDISKVPAFASRMKINSAPKIFLFNQQDITKLGEAHFYTFSIEHFDEEKLVKFISRYGNFSFSYTKTIPVKKLFLGLLTVFGVMIAGAIAWPFINKLLGNRKIWMAFTVGAVLVFTSGHLFVQMRSMPEHGRNQDGSKQMIAPGFQSQYGYESRLVAMLYFSFSFALTGMTYLAFKLKNPTMQRIAFYGFASILIYVFITLIDVFKVKNGGYPGLRTQVVW